MLTNDLTYDWSTFHILHLKEWLNPNFILLHQSAYIKALKASALNDLIRITKETQVLGENPLKFWERNKYLEKLDIINLELTNCIGKEDYTPNDINEFAAQIRELLDLKIIRISYLRHRSTTFMDRNHNEVKRGKSRMVINYKRLNDNTHEDAYKIPNKDQLINCIQGCIVFNNFDYKSRFW